MGKRGFKSESEENTKRLGLAPPPARPKPPWRLPKRAKVFWKEIVGSLPPDYFRRAELHLLEKFCMADFIYQEAMAEVKKSGIVITMGDRGYRVIHPALVVANKQVSLLCALSTKLRLATNSRVSKWVAGSAKESRPTTRPGLMFGEDE